MPFLPPRYLSYLFGSFLYFENPIKAINIENTVNGITINLSKPVLGKSNKTLSVDISGLKILKKIIKAENQKVNVTNGRIKKALLFSNKVVVTFYHNWRYFS
jgi:hypothetical protein